MPFSLDAPSLSPTPSPSPSPSAKKRPLGRGLHVLRTEAAALAQLAALYENDPSAGEAFDRAVQAIAHQSSSSTEGKLVVIGVGKSGHIGRKMVATLQSLAVRSAFLHPTEALHGDLGLVGPQDSLLFITHSGHTQELLLLLPHLDEKLPTIIMTSHRQPETCELMKLRPEAILLPAPIPEPERLSFGVPAPSTSTTVALALADALAMAAADELQDNLPSRFARNHPGGAIGTHTIRCLAVPWHEIAEPEGLTEESLGLDLLRAGYRSTNGWVRVAGRVAAPGAIRRLSNSSLARPLADIAGALVGDGDMMAMSSDTPIPQAGDLVRKAMQEEAEAEAEEEKEAEEGKEEEEEEEGAGRRCDGAPGGREPLIAVIEGGSLLGVLEAEEVLDGKS